MKRLSLLILLALSMNGFSQSAKPKLVVGIVIDQMRWDFLYKYGAQYGKDGFRRLLDKGFSCENTFIPYVPTYTAVGHTCVYTGSVPAISGIVGNNWFSHKEGRLIYCTEDPAVTSVGSTSLAGKMSPVNLWTTTVADELRLSNNFKSKVIGIALKDRGAILPAGHSANAAYWYDAGKWITSSYYMPALPQWVNDFNAKDLPGTYMSKDWTTLLPADQYSLSTADQKPYESKIPGDTSTFFPHRTSLIPANVKYEAFRYTPSGSSFTFDFAKAAIEHESLGLNNVTDFLTVSVSSPDYIGHTFGPNSVEIQDTYLRLDRDIADFLKYLDQKIGKGDYLLFITADHGVAHIPAFLKENRMPGGVFSESETVKELNKMISDSFGLQNIVRSVINYQVYLNHAEIQKSGKSLQAIKGAVIRSLKQRPYVTTAFSLDELQMTTLPDVHRSMISNGYNAQRSGDIQFMSKPAYFDSWQPTGTTHGLWNPYDSHIPLVWFGWNIRSGKLNRETYMTDIAPTIAAMLQIQMPNGSVGKVIPEIMKR